MGQRGNGAVINRVNYSPELPTMSKAAETISWQDKPCEDCGRQIKCDIDLIVQSSTDQISKRPLPVLAKVCMQMTKSRTVELQRPTRCMVSLV